MPRKSKVMTLSFAKLGEYRMHTHPLLNSELDECGPSKPFHCAIRNREELKTEVIDVFEGETLHGHDDSLEWPLVKFDRDGFWVWMPKQELWWPLRRGKIQLDLDRWNRVRVKWLDAPNLLI